MSQISASSAAAHIRDHRSVLAAAEKRLLIAIAERLPAWINSDHLSVLGLLGIVLTGACFALMAFTPLAFNARVVTAINSGSASLYSDGGA